MMDPAKLKVVELRAELQQRGLDTKGNKPVLVKRLKEALEAELQTELPDTSIADTSTEDISSQDEEVPSSQETVLKEPVKISEPHVQKDTKAPQEEPAPMKDELELCQKEKPVMEVTPEPVAEPACETTTVDKDVVPIEEKEEKAEPKEDPPVCNLPKEEEEKVQVEQIAQLEDQEMPQADEQEKPQLEEQDKPQLEAEQKPKDETKEEVVQKPEEIVQKVEQNGESTNGETEELKTQDVGEPKPKRSRWADDDSNATIVEQKEDVPSMDVDDQAKKDAKNEQRDEKRRHSSPSSEQTQRRCSSPIREDEPAVDSNKVQLSWYDSDLHLQIDKSNFLSAKPLSEGLFGYIWAGARFTHGVKAEKACFEVKLTEELRFEDILSSSTRSRDHREKRDRKDRRDDRSRTKSENGSEKSASLDKSENTETSDAATKEDNKPESAAAEGQTNDQEPMDTEPVSDSLDSDLTNDTKPEEAKPDAAAAAETEKPEEQTDNTTNQEVKPEAVKIPSHLIRIGWSSNKSSLQLGEDQFSYALESGGKFIANSEVITTEATFKCGDVVGAYLNMENLQMSFAVNGSIVYTHAIELKDDEADNFILFPHILSRNIAFEVNAGDNEEALEKCPDGYDDYVFISKLEDKIKGKSCYESRGDCEVIMMCGLPAAGKTHWVKDHIKTATDKSYNIIGSSFVMDRMTVDCKPIAPVIPSERLTLFRDKMGKILNRLCDIGGQRRRDFILDQTNVFPTAIRRKMRSFLGFKRHAVVIVNEDEEQEKRMKQQDPEPGNDMSVGALLEMKANMGLPTVGESVEMVTYVSLPEDKAQEQVKKYVKQGRDGGFGNISHHRREYRDDRNYNNRWQQRGSGGSGGGGGGGPRRDYHHRNNYRDRQYPPNNRYDRNYRQGSGGSGGGSNWRPGGGSGGGGGSGSWPARNDRRDRGPRDWRNNNRSGGGGGGMVERSQHRGSGNRDHRSHSNSSGGNYNRSRNQGSSSGGRWGGQSGWSSQSGSNSWSGSQSQEWNAGWNQTQGSWNQNQWKYGGGYNQGGYSQYPQNWNNYFSGSNYQDWNSPTSGGQGQNASSAQITSSSTNTTNSSNSSQYPQIASQQQQQAAWAYAHYAQNTTSNNSGSQK